MRCAGSWTWAGRLRPRMMKRCTTTPVTPARMTTPIQSGTPMEAGMVVRLVTHSPLIQVVTPDRIPVFDAAAAVAYATSANQEPTRPSPAR